mgnify:CR=1 FL=1
MLEDNHDAYCISMLMLELTRTTLNIKTHPTLDEGSQLAKYFVSLISQEFDSSIKTR